MAGEKLLNLGLCFALTTKRDLCSAILDMTGTSVFRVSS